MVAMVHQGDGVQVQLIGGVVMTLMIPGRNRPVIIINTGWNIREELKVPRYASREETVY